MRHVRVPFVARLKNIPVGVPYLDDYPPLEQEPSLFWVVKLANALGRTLVGVLR